MIIQELPELPLKFNPEQYITVPRSLIKKKRRLSGEKITGFFPSRIHIAPIDCNRFSYGHPGGGGIGFGIKSKNKLSLSISKKFSYTGPKGYYPIVRRAIFVVEKCFSLNTSFEVELSLAPEVSSHGGLGSNAIISSAILFASNLLFNRAFTDEEVRTLIAANFAECEEGMCCPGLETGLASAIHAFGGFNLVGDRIQHIWNFQSQNIPDIFLVRLDVSRPTFTGSEDTEMVVRSLKEDADHRGIRSYDILMDLLPAIEGGDLMKMGDFIWKIQFGGTHLSMIQRYGHHGAEVYNFICNVRSMGIEVVGMSSVGPTFFLISKDTKKIKKYLDNQKIKFYQRKIQNTPIYSDFHVE